MPQPLSSQTLAFLVGLQLNPPSSLTARHCTSLHQYNQNLNKSGQQFSASAANSLCATACIAYPNALRGGGRGAGGRPFFSRPTKSHQCAWVISTIVITVTAE